MTSTQQPSARALATRSLTVATRLKGKDRTDALQKHATVVWPVKSCTLLGRTTRL